MKILVDADACPVKEIIVEESASAKTEVIFIVDSSHILSYPSDLIRVVVVEKGADSVDFALVNRAKKGDICITADYGLAAMLQAKEAVVIHPNGFFYTDQNMDRLLFERHLSKEMRRQHKHHGHIPKRNRSWDNAFRNCLRRALNLS